jgi:hypothetical protein
MSIRIDPAILNKDESFGMHSGTISHYEEAVYMAYYSMYHSFIAFIFQDRHKMRGPFGCNYSSQ